MGGLLGGMAGASAASPDRGTAQNLINQSMGDIQGVQAPTDLANKLYLQQYASAGNLTPVQEQTINASPSQAAQTQANPNLVNAQMQALQGLKTASNTGMTPQTRAALNQIQQQAATQAEGQRQAVMQNYAQRGQAGSGNQLLAELNASQNAANQANQQSTQAAGQASQNALSALGQYGGQAGAMNQQQFGQQFQTGTAADQLNRFNVQNQQAQQARNVAQQNAAQQYNLQNQQGLSNANVGQANAEQQREVNAQQQMFADQMQRASALSGAQQTGANAYGNMANQIAQGWTNMGQGIDQGIASFAADGGEVPGYAAGGRIQAQSYNPMLGPAMQALAGGGWTNDNTALLSPSLTGNGGGGGGAGANGQQSGSDPVDYASLLKKLMGGEGPTTTGQANPWDLGGGMAGGPSDSISNAAPQSPGAGIGSGLMLNAARGITIPNPNMNNASLNPLAMALAHKTSIMQPKSQGLPPAAPPPRNPVQLAALANLISRGGSVPGKAMYAGDTIKNDRVHTALSPGEIVLPRSVAQAHDAPEKAKDFVAKEKQKKV